MTGTELATKTPGLPPSCLSALSDLIWFWNPTLSFCPWLGSDFTWSSWPASVASFLPSLYPVSCLSSFSVSPSLRVHRFSRDPYLMAFPPLHKTQEREREKKGHSRIIISLRIPMTPSFCSCQMFTSFLTVVGFPCYVLNKWVPFLSAVGHSCRWPFCFFSLIVVLLNASKSLNKVIK